MGEQRLRIAAFREALADTGAKELRLKLSTDKAVALVAELDEGTVRHPDELAVVVREWQELTPPAAGDTEAQLEYGAKLAKAADAFWSVFEGQEVDGVEIIRRRS